MKKLHKGVPFLMLFVLSFCVYLAVADAVLPNSPFCLTGESCDIVKNSAYSSLFGVKLTWWGLLFSVVLLGCYVLDLKGHIPREYLTFISGLGAAFSSYFLYVQVVILKRICSNCAIVDSIIILIFVLILMHREK